MRGEGLEIRPGNGADAKRIIGGGPLLEVCVRWRAGLRRLNQKVGVEMSHVLRRKAVAAFPLSKRNWRPGVKPVAAGLRRFNPVGG